MALIQNPTPTRKLQRALRLTELPDAVLAPELVGVFIVEDLSGPFAEESRGCAGSITQPGVGGQFPMGVLTRVGAPAAYNLTVKRIMVSAASGTFAAIVVGMPTAGVIGLTASDDTGFTDFQLPGRPSSQLGFDTPVALPAHRRLYAFDLIASRLAIIETDIRIGTIGEAPGTDFTSLMVASITASVGIRVSFDWVESVPLG